MSYQRVVPRDLFNDVNLLKNLGRLYILTEHLPNVSLDIPDYESDEDFEIEQDEDGNTFVSNICFTVDGEEIELFRPMNSRKSYPLFCIVDDEIIEVFTDDGQLSREFSELLEVDG